MLRPPATLKIYPTILSPAFSISSGFQGTYWSPSLDILQGIWPDFPTSDLDLAQTHKLKYVYTTSTGHATRETRRLLYRFFLLLDFTPLLSSLPSYTRLISLSQTATVSTCSTSTPPALLKLRQSLHLHQTIRIDLFPVSKPKLTITQREQVWLLPPFFVSLTVGGYKDIVVFCLVDKPRTFTAFLSAFQK